MSASAPKSTTDTAPELQLTEEERELLSIRTVPEFEAAQAARRRAKALAKAPESHLATVRRARKSTASWAKLTPTPWLNSTSRTPLNC